MEKYTAEEMLEALADAKSKLDDVVSTLEQEKELDATQLAFANLILSVTE